MARQGSGWSRTLPRAHVPEVRRRSGIVRGHLGEIPTCLSAAIDASGVFSPVLRHQGGDGNTKRRGLPRTISALGENKSGPWSNRS